MCITSVENIPVGGHFRLSPDGVLYERGYLSSDGYILCVRNYKEKARRTVEVFKDKRVIYVENL